MPGKKRPAKATSASNDAPALGRDRILAAALALLDARGVDAFNLRELAKSLDVYPTAIYWHVSSREELLAGAVALAMQNIAASRIGGVWQARLRTLFRRFRTCLQRHPNIAPLVAARLGSNTTADPRVLEWIVAALEEAGFAGTRLVDAFNVVVAAMCGFATLELAQPPAGDPLEWQRACEQRIAGFASADYPALARHLGELENRAFIVRWSSGTDRPLDAAFAAWIDTVIGGLEKLALSGAERSKSRRARANA